jgi:hypothetical protein
LLPADDAGGLMLQRKTMAARAIGMSSLQREGQRRWCDSLVAHAHILVHKIATLSK